MSLDDMYLRVQTLPTPRLQERNAPPLAPYDLTATPPEYVFLKTPKRPRQRKNMENKRVRPAVCLGISRVRERSAYLGGF